MNDTEKLVRHCRNALDLGNAKLGDEFYYAHLPLAVLDAVFSIRMRYSRVVEVVQAYSAAYDLEAYQKSYNLRKKVHTIKNFIDNVEAVGVDDFSEQILHTKNRTAGRNSILKLEAALSWAKILQANNIEDFSDIKLNYNDNVSKGLQSVQGQGGGVSVKYFEMLCGDDSACKPDTHLLRFLSNAVGCEVKPNEAQELLSGAVAELKNDYKSLTVRLLDFTIWQFQSKTKN